MSVGCAVPGPGLAGPRSGRRRGAAGLLLAALVVSACGPAGPPAEWTVDLDEDLRVGDDPVTLQTAFYQPSDLGLDARGNVYVLDRGNHRVQVFDPAGGYLRTIGRRGEGPGELTAPEGLWVDADGSIIVADTRSRRLQRFDAAGEPDDPLELDYFPFDVAADADRLFVLRFPQASLVTGADPRPMVQVLERRSGVPLGEFVEARPSGVGVLYLLQNLLKIAPGPEGVALADTHVHSRLRVYDAGGTPLREIPVLYKAGAWAPLGRLPETINDASVDRVARTASGLAWDERRHLWWLLAGRVDRTPDGTWVTGRELYRYAPDGSYQGSAVLPGDSVAVAVGPDARVWTLDTDGILHAYRVRDPEAADSGAG